jgi:hypothetical protein
MLKFVLDIGFCRLMLLSNDLQLMFNVSRSVSDQDPNWIHLRLAPGSRMCKKEQI